MEVVNAPPAFDAPSYAFVLRENEDGRDRPVALGRTAATDPDGDEVAYALVAGDGRRFAVGTLRTGRWRTPARDEDYEAEPTPVRADNTRPAIPTGRKPMAEVTDRGDERERGSVGVGVGSPASRSRRAAPRPGSICGPYFVDPDGDPLSYAAVSSDTSVAAVCRGGFRADADARDVRLGNDRGDGARSRRALCEADLRGGRGRPARPRWCSTRPLAASARAHLASARMTLGRKVAQGRASAGSMLTVLGYRVPLSRGGGARGGRAAAL